MKFMPSLVGDIYIQSVTEKNVQVLDLMATKLNLNYDAVQSSDFIAESTLVFQTGFYFWILYIYQTVLRMT